MYVQYVDCLPQPSACFDSDSPCATQGVPVSKRRGDQLWDQFWDQFWDQGSSGSPRPFCTNVAQLDQDKAGRHDSIVQFPQILAPQRLHLPNLKSVRRQIIWPVGFQFLATAKSSADEVCGLPRVFVLVQFHGILMVLTPSRPHPCPHPCLTLSEISWRFPDAGT